MPLYSIKRKFFDGAVLHPMDAVLEFEEGKQPRSAALLTPEKAKEHARRAKALKAAAALLAGDEVEEDETVLDTEVALADAKEGDTLHSLTAGKKAK